MKRKYFVGTSGWSYKHWVGPFYSENIDSADFLSFYAETFDSVEVNNTFYKLPEKEVVESWRDRTPRNFLFAVKANRYITHMKNLKDAKKPVERLLQTVSLFKDKLGPILFQLPTRWHVNVQRLRAFLEVLPDDYMYVFEFRHKSWHQKRIYDLLIEANVALCIQDISGEFSPMIETADFVYIRFHGPEGKYKGRYQKNEIMEWSKRIKDWIKDDKTVYAFFNNDNQANAVYNAKELKSLLNI